MLRCASAHLLAEGKGHHRVPFSSPLALIGSQSEQYVKEAVTSPTHAFLSTQQLLIMLSFLSVLHGADTMPAGYRMLCCMRVLACTIINIR